MSEQACPNCGAPHAAGYAACRYCATPFVANTQTDAIACPSCHTLNELGAQRCVQCQAWVVVECVFCHAVSPYNQPACTRCGEGFAGAPERLAERQQQERLQHGLQIAGQVGQVAASVLGVAAVAGVFSGHTFDDAPSAGGLLDPLLGSGGSDGGGGSNDGSGWGS